MCGRFSLHGSEEELRIQFAVADLPALTPRYNIAPSQDVLCVRASPADGRTADMLRWGLVPGWSKEPRTRYSMINARAETVAEKPAYRRAFRQRRCLIPASGFYEWRQTGKGKQPWYIHMRDQRVFAFAGLWEHWQDDAGHTLDSCSIVVTTPNALVGTIHDRMPVVLAPEDYERWLDPQLQDPTRLKPLLAPYPAQAMEAYPVPRTVNSPSNEGPELIVPAD